MNSHVSPAVARTERILLGSSIAGVLILLMIVSVLLVREHSSAKDAAIRTSSNLLQLIDADVQRNVELYDRSLLGMIEVAKDPDLEKIPPRLRHQLLFGRAITSPLRGDLLWVGENGHLLADSLASPPRTADFSERASFQLQRDGKVKGLLISPPFQDALGDLQWCISLSRRISAADGRFEGIASGALRLSYFNDLFKSLNIGDSSSVSLLSTEGYILAREPEAPGQSLTGSKRSPGPNLKRILEGGSSGSFTAISSIDQQERLYTYARVGDLPFVVVAALSTESVYGAWKRTALLVTAATGVLCLGLLWLNILLRHELRRRRRAERDLRALAATDGLTGLANRRTLDQTLRFEWARAARSRKALSMLMMDVDHFKAFNERHGHAGGDQALRAVANLIAECVHRPADLTARYGGEEFVVILPETDHEGAIQLAETIRRRVEASSPIGERLSPVTVSIGVSTLKGDPAQPLSGLINAADLALYQAKDAGRNRVCFIQAAESIHKKTPTKPA